MLNGFKVKKDDNIKEIKKSNKINKETFKKFISLICSLILWKIHLTSWMLSTMLFRFKKTNLKNHPKFSWVKLKLYNFKTKTLLVKIQNLKHKFQNLLFNFNKKMLKYFVFKKNYHPSKNQAWFINRKSTCKK